MGRASRSLLDVSSAYTIRCCQHVVILATFAVHVGNEFICVRWSTFCVLALIIIFRIWSTDADAFRGNRLATLMRVRKLKA